MCYILCGIFPFLPDMLEEEVQSGDSDYLTAAKLHYQSCLDSNTRFDSSLGKSIFVYISSRYKSEDQLRIYICQLQH